MASFNPIRKSRLKPKAKRAKTSWRTGKVRLDAKGMSRLRWEVYQRAEGQCENSSDGVRCNKRITWTTFQLHHLKHRSLGGDDSEFNCVAVCFDCHDLHHHGQLRIEPHVPLARPE